MPVHDWTRVTSGLFHEFHQSWCVRIKDALNSNLLPPGFYALVEQRTGGPEPDVIAVEVSPVDEEGIGAVGVAVRPLTKIVQRFETDEVNYARRANRIAVRHELGEVVAAIEIVSRGNKSSQNAIRSFIDKTADFLRAGVHLLVIDLFPPAARDPHGIHNAIMEDIGEELLPMPEDKPLTLVGYDATMPMTAYIEPVAVGDRLPDMPLFLQPGRHILVPLEATYQATWGLTPKPIRDLLEPATR